MKPYVLLGALLTAIAGPTLLLAASNADAQTVYRSGKNSFSDQAPAASTAPSVVGSVSSAGNGTQLPYELRQVVQRYPVTIYTSENCSGCSAGRSLLTTRGIPFDERTIKSAEDVAALQRLSGQSGVPLLTIGAQQLKGFSDSEWSQYLDAAGYPTSTQLPAGFSNPPARPMVAQQAAPAPVQAAAPAAPATSSDADSAPAERTPSNPAGIKF